MRDILKLLFFISWSSLYVEDVCLNLVYQPFVSTTLYTFFSDFTLIITLKITLCLMFLIVIRGCIPRYRYDFLTKMGWVKFLGHVLAFFIVSITFFFLW